MDLTQKVFELGREVAEAADASLSDALKRFVSAFAGKPYIVESGPVETAAGQPSEPFSCVVFTRQPRDAAVRDGAPLPVERAAAVIDAHEDLSVDGLQASYERIALAKRLKQDSLSTSATTGTRKELLGLVLAVRSELTLEAIAEEMQRLNERLPANQWPDMVIVSGTGLVQYSAQFPGENVTGDFFLPGETLSYTPPMYIVMVMKPAGAHSLNRMLAFMVGHLALFSPDSRYGARSAQPRRGAYGISVKPARPVGTGAEAVLQRPLPRAPSVLDRGRTWERTRNGAVPTLAGRRRDSPPRQIPDRDANGVPRDRCQGQRFRQAARRTDLVCDAHHRGGFPPDA